jgi:hypothetical protein
MAGDPLVSRDARLAIYRMASVERIADTIRRRLDDAR